MKLNEELPTEPLKITTQDFMEIQQLLTRAMETRVAEKELGNVINHLKTQLEKTKRQANHAESLICAFIDNLSETPSREVMALYCLGNGSIPKFNAARKEMARAELGLMTTYMADKPRFVQLLASGIEKYAKQRKMDDLFTSRRATLHP